MARLIDSVIERFNVLAGHDPITKDYKASLLSYIADMTLSEIDKKDFEEDLRFRQAHDIAPGFKDSSKSDGGSGDLLIWKTILKYSKDLGKDALFVTGETKSDWFDRIDKKPISPRYELIEEFRRETNGKSVHIVSASRFLELMEASGKVVQLTAALEAESFLSSAKLTVKRFTEQDLEIDLKNITMRLQAVDSFINSAESYVSGADRSSNNAAGGEAIGYLNEFRHEKAELETRRANIIEALSRGDGSL